MGDRALIHFHDEQSVSPAIYLHWDGYRVRELIDQTQKVMEGRGGDVPYATARAIGVANEMIPGNLSLGVFDGPNTGDFTTDREAMMKPEYSHGDAGVFLVNCKTWEVETFGGYGLREPDED